jgi:hypothetical protein
LCSQAKGLGKSGDNFANSRTLYTSVIPAVALAWSRDTYSKDDLSEEDLHIVDALYKGKTRGPTTTYALVVASAYIWSDANVVALNGCTGGTLMVSA